MIYIGKNDIFWNYAATFLKVASSALLLPFILKMMPSEMVGLWTVFMTVTAFAGLLDFGFNPSFARNITYVFSGVRTLKTQGFELVISDSQEVDFSLLKGVIAAMRWFYLRISVILFLLLSTLGTYYIHKILQNYNGDHNEVYIAWTILCLISTYNLFTQYFDSLLQGKGLVKLSKQIVIIGYTAYLIIASILLIYGSGLIAIISAQAISVIIIRWLSYYAFFTKDMIQKLDNVLSKPIKPILDSIYPNATKIGLTVLGAFMAQRSAIIIGPLYLSLSEIASFGITTQLISVISGFAGIYIATYQPRITQMRVLKNSLAISDFYLKGIIILLFTYLFGGGSLLIIGEWLLNIIGSQTKLLPTFILSIALIISMLENNHALAGNILLTKNEVPFFKASLIAGLLTIFLLIILFNFLNIKIWAMILAPGIAHLYNNFKWPHEVFIQLSISKKDIKSIIFSKINSKYGK